MDGTRDTNPGAPRAEALIEEGAAFMALHLQEGTRERVDVVVIGGGQAGLSVGHHLAKRGVRFVILDAHARTGDAWRQRWDSLRLFTAAKFDGLPGLAFPGDPESFPTKDEMAAYLEAYAARFALPVRSGVRVTRLFRRGDLYVVEAEGRTWEASQVVVAMASYQRRHVPAFAGALDPSIAQLHSSAYRNLGQLHDGPVLIVGAGNSGSEIAMEAARAGREVWMAGRDVGSVPFRPSGFWGRAVLCRLLLRVLFHRVLTVKTAIGRKAREKFLAGGGPLIRVKPKDLAAAGVRRVPRVARIENGRPVLEDGRALDVKNVVWCTGYERAHGWIDLPVFDDDGTLRHDSGVVRGQPGLCFVGLTFLHAASSSMIHGVGRDAQRIAETVARRIRANAPAVRSRLG